MYKIVRARSIEALENRVNELGREWFPIGGVAVDARLVMYYQAMIFVDAYAGPELVKPNDLLTEKEQYLGPETLKKLREIEEKEKEVKPPKDRAAGEDNKGPEHNKGRKVGPDAEKGKGRRVGPK